VGSYGEGYFSVVDDIPSSVRSYTRVPRFWFMSVSLVCFLPTTSGLYLISKFLS